MAASSEQWQRGREYEAFMGRWSRLVAGEFLAWLNASRGLRWLDVGAGTGALSAAIITCADPLAVHGIDASADFVAVARRQVSDARVRFSVGDAHRMAGAIDATFDVAVSGLVLNFLEPTEPVVSAMRHAVAPGGLVAGYVWDYRRMELLTRFWSAAARLDPGASELDEAVRFSAWTVDHLELLWHDAGMTEVQTTVLAVELELEGFDDYWAPFLGGQGPAPGYLATLDDQRRDNLRQRMESDMSFPLDEPLALQATAIAVSGTA